MLNSGQAMYLSVPTTSEQRLLQSGKVVESSKEAFSIELEKPHELTLGLETLAFCEVRGKFFQQGVTLTEIQTESIVPVYLFRRETEPVSAEQRQTFRVSVALANITAHIGPQKKCQIADFSAEGLSAIGSPGLAIGSVQKLILNYEQFAVNADARIQTVKVLATGKIRYGLLVPNSNVAARNALQKVTAGFQRTQLKRLAGAA